MSGRRHSAFLHFLHCLFIAYCMHARLAFLISTCIHWRSRPDWNGGMNEWVELKCWKPREEDELDEMSR
jgi:hypothetical protein